MKKTVTIICFLLLVGLGVFGSKAHSGEPYTGLHEARVQYGEEEGDCLAWKFILAVTLNSKITQTTIRDMNKKSVDDGNVENYLQPFSVYVDKMLPVRTARKIINTIIKREGGICSRELLYDTPCFMSGQRGKVHAALLLGEIKFNYLHRITGVAVDKSSVAQLDDFLRKHMSKSPGTKAFYTGVSCKDSCTDHVHYELFNSFGFCILKKHQDYLKEMDIFDLSSYDYKAKYHFQVMDQESLRSFIQRSNEIAEENRQRSGQLE